MTRPVLPARLRSLSNCECSGRLVRPIAVPDSLACSWQARSSLRRESMPVAAWRGPTTSVPSAASNSPSLVTNSSPRPTVCASRSAVDRRSTSQVRPSSRRAKRLIFGCRFDESVGPAHHARLGRQVDVVERRQQVAGCRAAESRRGRRRVSGWPLQPLEQSVGRREHDELRPLAERHFHQRRRIDVDVKQIGHHAAHLAERSVWDPRAAIASTSCTPPSRPSSRFQLGQHGDPLANPRELAFHAAMLLVGARQFAAHVDQPPLGRSQCRAVLLDLRLRSRLPLVRC